MPTLGPTPQAKKHSKLRLLHCGVLRSPPRAIIDSPTYQVLRNSSGSLAILDTPRLILAEQLGCGSSPRRIFVIDVGERLPCAVLDDEASEVVFSCPGRREAVRGREIYAKFRTLIPCLSAVAVAAGRVIPLARPNLMPRRRARSLTLTADRPTLECPAIL
jgi:hypothetical protein